MFSELCQSVLSSRDVPLKTEKRLSQKALQNYSFSGAKSGWTALYKSETCNMKSVELVSSQVPVQRRPHHVHPLPPKALGRSLWDKGDLGDGGTIIIGGATDHRRRLHLGPPG